jgi:hypothetical protein
MSYPDPTPKPSIVPCPSPLPTSTGSACSSANYSSHLPSPPIIWCDSSSALALASNPVSHARTKHIEVNVHFIREKVTNKDIQHRYLSTIDQVANVFTKSLTANRFCFLRDKLPVVPPISLQGVLRILQQTHTTQSYRLTASTQISRDSRKLDNMIFSPYKTYS